MGTSIHEPSQTVPVQWPAAWYCAGSLSSKTGTKEREGRGGDGSVSISQLTRRAGSLHPSPRPTLSDQGFLKKVLKYLDQVPLNFRWLGRFTYFQYQITGDFDVCLGIVQMPSILFFFLNLSSSCSERAALNNQT